MEDLMTSMSELFTKAGEKNSIILDNANLDIKYFKYFDYLKTAYMKALNSEIVDFEFGYNQPAGGKKLIEKIAVHESYLNQCEILEKDIVISGNGVTGVLSSLFYYWKKQGVKKVIVPTPIYSAIVYGLRYFEVECIAVGTKIDNSFLPVFSDIKNAYTKDVSAVLLVNPGNPVCKYMDKEELINIIKFCVEKNLYLVIDAIFEEAPGVVQIMNQYFSWAQNYRRLIKIKGMSKEIPHFSDLRIGWLISKNEHLNEQLRYFNCMTNYSNSRMAEYLVSVEYDEKIKKDLSTSYINEEAKIYKHIVVSSIRIIVEWLKRQTLVKNVLVPDCGNIIYFQIDEKIKSALKISNAKDLALWLLDNESVLLSPASDFFHETNELWMRITLCFQYDFILKILEKSFKHLNEIYLNIDT